MTYKRVRLYRVRNKWSREGKAIFVLDMALAALTTLNSSLFLLLLFGLVAFMFVIIPAYYIKELQEKLGEIER
jgi:hypothetical protein